MKIDQVIRVLKLFPNNCFTLNLAATLNCFPLNLAATLDFVLILSFGMRSATRSIILRYLAG